LKSFIDKANGRRNCVAGLSVSRRRRRRSRRAFVRTFGFESRKTTDVKVQIGRRRIWTDNCRS
jgi:hypothetical protein